MKDIVYVCILSRHSYDYSFELIEGEGVGSSKRRLEEGRFVGLRHYFGVTENLKRKDQGGKRHSTAYLVYRAKVRPEQNVSKAIAICSVGSDASLRN